MGRFFADIEIVNDADLVQAEAGNLPADKVRRKTIRGLVDSGASRLVLPQAVVKELGLTVKKAKTRVPYADGRRAPRPEVDRVRVWLQHRDGVFTAVAEPNRDTALIGAVVLEDLDFLVDCKKSLLVPRDPAHVVSELE